MSCVSSQRQADRSDTRRPHHPYLTGSRPAAREIKPASVVRVVPRPQDASRIEIMAWRFYAAIGMAILMRHWHAIISSKRGGGRRIGVPAGLPCLAVFTRVFEYFRDGKCRFLSLCVSGSLAWRAECSKICVHHLRAKIKLRHCMHGTTRPRSDTNINHDPSRIATRGPSCQD